MKQFSTVFLCVICFFSCGRKQESNPITSPASRTFILERENFFNSLKEHEDVSNLVSILDFKSDFLNDPDKYYQYTSNSVKAAANLGVYISNLNYCIVFKEKDAIKKYFNASYELSKAIQIDKSFLEFLLKRYETNIEQNDSVKAVIHQLFNQATAGLKDTDRERLAGITMAGYQLENLHLLLSTLASFSDKPTPEQTVIRQQILQYIFEYQGKFEVIYQFIRANSDPLDPDKNPNYPFFDNGIRELIDEFRSISQQDPQLENLTEKVNALRNGIVIP